MAICDSNYKFVLIDVGAYDKFGNSGIFKNSNFYKKNAGKSSEHSQTVTYFTKVYYLFTIRFCRRMKHSFASTTMMRPYARNDLNVTKKKTYNYRHCKARRYVECTFGIFANKWCIFHKPINVNIDFSK